MVDCVVTNRYSGVLTIPDGRDIQPGETTAIPHELIANEGVKIWIGEGWLEVAPRQSEKKRQR